MKFEQIGEDSWESTENQIFEYGKGGISVLIEKGFVTDFATLPWIVKFFIDKTDPKYALPCAVHDKNYASKRFSKIMADAILYQALKESGVDPKIRLGFYLGVTFFGWCRWRK